MNNPKTATANQAEGWNWLYNSKKWHYFRDGHSLCRHWMTFAKDGFDTQDFTSPDECKSCRKKVDKEKSSLLPSS